MWLASLHRLLLGKSRSRQVRHGRSQRPRFIPTLDYLEERITPSSTVIYVTDPSGGMDNPTNVIVSGLGSNVTLRDAINAADNTGGSSSYVIDLSQLPANSIITFNAVDNSSNGPNALPVITPTDLTIKGYGATLNAASLARLFDVASGAGLTLDNLTLEHGKASGANAQGGAIYDAGNNLTLKTVVVEFNAAVATGQTANGAGNSAQGGGLYVSGGTVHLTNCNITNNQATGGQGAAGAAGGAAQGGGVYANGATLIISGGSVKDQHLNGGSGGAGTANKLTGGAGGNAVGGGIYAQGGAVTLSNGATILDSTVKGGEGGNGGSGGTGGAGGNAEGGGVAASNTVVVMNGGANANNDTLDGGWGGAGNGVGQGGAGGQALGGGVFAKGGSVTISGGAYISVNFGRGGTGGTGGSGGTGGVGGAAEGGGLYVLAAPLTLTSGTVDPQKTSAAPGINTNTIEGGQGGYGGGGSGGAGGVAQGGGVFASGNNNFAVIIGSANQAASINWNGVNGGGVNGGLGGNAGTHGAGGAGGNATGGGMSVIGDKLILTNATLYGNNGFGGNGGNGVVSSKGYVISGFGNGGNVLGGGLYVSGSSSVTVLNSTFAVESADGGGGGTAIAAPGVKYGIGGTVQGGGLFAGSSTVSVLNSTFADNLLAAGTGSVTPNAAANARETAQGGGLYAANGSLSLINDTIAWNDLETYTDKGQIPGQGGGVYYTSSNNSSNTLKLANTIIALNQLFTLYNNGGSQYGSPSDSENDLYDTVASSDHDLIGNGSGSSLTNSTNGDQVGSPGSLINPQFVGSPTTNSFGSLGSVTGQLPANYGGLTYTLPLAATSSALNAGDASTTSGSPVALIAAAEKVSIATATDQRGMARIINNEIDIGATQSGLLLSGSAPTTVQAGQDLTYTFTLSNNGPSSLSNVTLSDTLPANTTFLSLSAPTGWTTTTPTGGTGAITATIGTLAADTTATFTLTVLVGSGAQGTTVVNNASVTYTGTANPVSSSVSLSTTVPGPATTNITNEVGLFETPIRRDPLAGPGTYIQAAMFINESGAAISGPVALVLTGLPAGVTVTNANGTYNGSPYINIEPPGGTWLPGVRYFLFALITFSDPSHVKITYTPEVVQGI